MKFSMLREDLLVPLQQVTGVIERRQTIPILGNVLLELLDGQLKFTGTDLEVQLITRSAVDGANDGRITVPARKLLDICRLLPEHSTLTIDCRSDRFVVQSGRGRFALSTLPAENYPEFDAGSPEREFSLPAAALRRALEKTLFAMAQQDVRYYLNGVMFEVEGAVLRTVASDGHRLALFEEEIEGLAQEPIQVIVPRKGVLELFRLLGDDDTPVVIQLGSNSMRIVMKHLEFAAKLIEGRYPDYRRVLPAETSRRVLADRNELKLALTRVSVLSNEKFRGVNIEIAPGVLRLKAQNPEHEEAEEEIAVQLEGEEFHVGFNAAYLLDAINAIHSETVSLSFTDAISSCLIEDCQDQRCKYIVMPMRL